jgi:hypothetical protein
MTQPEELTQLELEHAIRYGTWEERAAHDPLTDEDRDETDDDGEGDGGDVEDEEIPLSLSDLELLDPNGVEAHEALAR